MLGRLVLAIVSCMLFASVSCQSIDLTPGKSFEVYRNLQVGEAWGVQFQLVEGAVSFQLSSPEGVIHEGDGENYGSYSLTAKSAGMHTFRFNNKESVTRKISFRTLGSGDRSSSSANRNKLDPVQNELRRLNGILRSARDEHAFLMDREMRHRELALSTNSRVMWWFICQVLVVGGVCYFQINSLKRFFEVRRMV